MTEPAALPAYVVSGEWKHPEAGTARFHGTLGPTHPYGPEAYVIPHRGQTLIFPTMAAALAWERSIAWLAAKGALAPLDAALKPPAPHADLDALQGVLDLFKGHYGLADWARACRIVQRDLPDALEEIRWRRENHG